MNSVDVECDNNGYYCVTLKYARDIENWLGLYKVAV